MSPHGLETLYVELGKPAWFWPLVLSLLLALIVLGSSISPVLE